MAELRRNILCQKNPKEWLLFIFLIFFGSMMTIQRMKWWWDEWKGNLRWGTASDNILTGLPHDLLIECCVTHLAQLFFLHLLHVLMLGYVMAQIRKRVTDPNVCLGGGAILLIQLSMVASRLPAIVTTEENRCQENNSNQAASSQGDGNKVAFFSSCSHSSRLGIHHHSSGGEWGWRWDASRATWRE